MEELFGPEGRAALERLARRRALVALDFDGTLAPVAPHHAGARMRRRTQALLAEVARLYPSAVVSGRSRDDLARRLDGLGVHWLVGNHGAELGGTGDPALRRRVAAWTRALRARLAGEPGVEVEAKGLSLSVHYRRARHPAAARAAIREAAGRLEGARLQEGKRVVNVLGRGAPDKGDALAALVRRSGAQAVLFAGDDVTDEDAFARDLGVESVTVRVGRSRTSRAAFHVGGQGAVDRLLAALVDLRRPRGERDGDARPAGGGPPPARTLGLLEDLWALVHALETRSKRMHRTIGVTGPQRLLLRVVGARPGCSPGEAARHLRAHPASVTRLVDGLEARGFVRRVDHAHDGRRVHLELTERGRQVAELRTGTIEEALRAALAGVAPRRVADARALLRRVAGAVAGSPPGGGPAAARRRGNETRRAPARGSPRRGGR